jgi:hypothetical protein
MKKNLIYLLAMMIIPSALFLGCKDDEPDGPQAPTLSISVDPLITESEPGETIEYTITVAGDLKAVTLNGAEIKTFEEGTFNDTFTYEYTFPADASADAELTFAVVDREDNTVNTITQVSLIMPDYTLADFSVKIADEAMWSDHWEGESLNPIPGATYNGGDASPSMYVTSRGGFADNNWDFAADLPDDGNGLMMTRLSIREETGGTAWGGYMIPVFGWYGAGMTKPSSTQLDLVKVGQRVIAIDVYYETDATSPKSFSDLSVAGQGVKFQLRLGNLVKYKASGDKAGWFIAKEAFVAEPNKWVTLYFDADDVREIEGDPDDEEDNGLTMDGASNEVDFAWFIPAMGQDHWDSHKIFLKNFRITNAE